MLSISIALHQGLLPRPLFLPAVSRFLGYSTATAPTKLYYRIMDERFKTSPPYALVVLCFMSLYLARSLLTIGILRVYVAYCYPPHPLIGSIEERIFKVAQLCPHMLYTAHPMF